jgi:hypothetical protein
MQKVLYVLGKISHFNYFLVPFLHFIKFLEKGFWKVIKVNQGWLSPKKIRKYERFFSLTMQSKMS